MTWFLLETLFALVVAIAIVWWTMGGKRKKESREPHDESGGAPPR
jgi:hypothetical protein